MALRSFAVRRAAASLVLVAGRGAGSSLSPLANRSPSSSSSSSVLGLSASRLLPFSTNASSIKSPNQKQTARVPQLDGLPFDYMEVDRDEEAMYLRRKTKDEIIEILVKTHMKYEDYENDYLYVYDDSGVYDDYDWNAGDNAQDDFGDDEMVNKMGFETNEEDKKSNQVDCCDDEEGDMINEAQFNEIERTMVETNEEDEVDWNSDDGDYLEVNAVPKLTLLGRILYGHNFDRCLEFVARAYPDDHSKLRILGVSFRKPKRRGQPVGVNHLDEFEGFFKKRGIEAGNLNYLLKCVDRNISIDF